MDGEYQGYGASPHRATQGDAGRAWRLTLIGLHSLELPPPPPPPLPWRPQRPFCGPNLWPDPGALQRAFPHVNVAIGQGTSEKWTTPGEYSCTQTILAVSKQYLTTSLIGLGVQPPVTKYSETPALAWWRLAPIPVRSRPTGQDCTGGTAEPWFHTLQSGLYITYIPHCVWMGHLHVLISWRLPWGIYPLRPVAKDRAWKGITLFFACHYMKNQNNPQYKTPLSLRACLYPFRKSWICICNSSGG